MLFRILFAIDAVIAAVILYFFFVGLGDGSVSSFNMGLWLAILGGVAAILFGAWMLNGKGQRAAANVILLLLALPGGLYGFFILLVLILQPNWR